MKALSWLPWVIPAKIAIHATLKKKYDTQFKAVSDAIRELMAPPPTKKRPIGFASWEEKK